MPKLEGASISRKISLDDIIDTGNIRENYQGIEELASSIKQNGQLQPIIVKNTEPAMNGSPRFELIAGHRRRQAFQYLKDHGDDFSMIDAVVVTGDKLTIQLIENIQRSDLSSRERERGIYLMLQNGISQKEIAAKLSKSDAYISKHLSAYKIRQIAENADIDTSELETYVISEIQAVKEEHIPMVLGYIIRDGGTQAAARKIVQDYRPLKKRYEETPEQKTETAAAPGETEQIEPPDPKEDSIPREKKQEPAGSAAPKTVMPPRMEITHQPIPHKQIDINDIFQEIYAYLSALEEKIDGTWAGSDVARMNVTKREAVFDIIALIHKKIGTNQD